MKKFFLTLLAIFLLTTCASANSNYLDKTGKAVALADGVGAWKFLQNWGFGDYWDKNNIWEDGCRLPGTTTYVAFIPAKISGLANIFPERNNSGTAAMITFPNGELFAIKLVFDGSSPNPKGTLAEALAAAIGKENFERDEENFFNAVSNVLNGQNEFYSYYSATMQRYYFVGLTSFADCYEIALWALVEGD